VRRLGKSINRACVFFTFNDTIVIVYLAADGHGVTLATLRSSPFASEHSCCHSLENRILLRGSISVGSFRRVETAQHTVMGAAVSDAAAWYNQSRLDWRRGHTPATMFIQSLMEPGESQLSHILIDYPVPMKGRSAVTLKALNWPKGFYVRGLRPKSVQITARSILLSFLLNHRVPLGTESKYSNAIAFFDFVKKAQELGSGKHGSGNIREP
jgi:hypothetical protein